MIRLKISILLLGLCWGVYGQNAYNFEHTFQFGQYLLNTNQYELAADEFEQAVFYQPKDSLSNYLLFKTYSLLHNKDRALRVYLNYTQDSTLTKMPAAYASIYSKLLFQREEYTEGISFFGSNCCLPEKALYLTSSFLILKDWEGAKTASLDLNRNIPSVTPILNLVDKTDILPYKKPGLGALFSAVLPGGGKFYSGRWEDGIVSLVMTSVSGFLAVRAYNRYGPNHGYTWFVGAVAAGYYGGNIYGGYQSVKKYNDNLETQIADEAKHYILHY